MRCLLVNPRFRNSSFWNYRDTCRAVGARYPAAPLSLITVAAMLPQDWELRLVDCNVEAWDPDALDGADIVLVGGMIVQQLEALSLIREAKQRGKAVVVGGPDATSSPHLYAEADHLVLGEAELTLPRFLDDFARGRKMLGRSLRLQSSWRTVTTRAAASLGPRAYRTLVRAYERLRPGP